MPAAPGWAHFTHCPLYFTEQGGVKAIQSAIFGVIHPYSTPQTPVTAPERRSTPFPVRGGYTPNKRLGCGHFQGFNLQAIPVSRQRFVPRTPPTLLPVGVAHPTHTGGTSIPALVPSAVIRTQDTHLRHHTLTQLAAEEIDQLPVHQA